VTPVTSLLRSDESAKKNTSPNVWKTSVANPDPDPLDLGSGSGMEKKSGSWMNITDHIFQTLKTIFGVKNTEIL
jgi:hypothetical protein